MCKIRSKAMPQILDYSSWLKKLSERELDRISRDYFSKNNLPYKSLHTAFEEFFKVSSSPTLGSELVNVLFAQEYPEDLLNAVSYLKDSGVPIYLLKFNWFKDYDDRKYISIEKVIGEDEEENNDLNNFSEPADSKNISKKLSTRKILAKVKSYLENNYQQWVNQFEAECKGFILYQTRAGDWSFVRTEWKVNDGWIHFGFGIAFTNNRKRFVCRISYPKNYNNVNVEKAVELLTNSGFIDKSTASDDKFWKVHTQFVKDLKSVNVDEEFTLIDDEALNFVKAEMPIFSAAIELLLPKK